MKALEIADETMSPVVQGLRRLVEEEQRNRALAEGERDAALATAALFANELARIASVRSRALRPGTYYRVKRFLYRAVAWKEGQMPFHYLSRVSASVVLYVSPDGCVRSDVGYVGARTDTHDSHARYVIGTLADVRHARAPRKKKAKGER